jgi:hypothetical protein
MRKFAFVILNESDEIIDRYNLDYVTNLSGLGYKLKVSTISTDVEDYVTKIIQEKKALTFTVTHLTGYSGGQSLVNFLQQYNDSDLCLEYNNGLEVLYLECKVNDVGKTELSEFSGVLEQNISILPLTPFFEKVENATRIERSSVGKSYPFHYAYSYGLIETLDNEIENVYIKEIPLIVEIYGVISNPIVTLRNATTNVVYNEVRFLGVDLLAGQKIIINSAQKKIWFDDGTGNLVDYYYKLDEAYDSYLRASSLTTSKLTLNLGINDTGYLTGRRRQYKL